MFIIDAKERGQIAKMYFLQGYGCCQSLLLAYHDIIGLDEDKCAALGAPFGGGIGRMREVCGTVNGALMVYGIITGQTSPMTATEKNAYYSKIREFAEKFKFATGKCSINCRELLQNVSHTDGFIPEERNSDYYARRPCPELCRISAEILAEMLQQYFQ